MSRLLFNITKKCNALCIFCEIPIPEKKESFPTYEEVIEKFESMIRNRKFDEIAITGGEPGIWPHIFEFIQYVKSKNLFKVILFESNGLIYSSREYIKRLIESGVNRFQMSFQSIDSKNYEFIIRVKNAFPLIKKALEDLKLLKEKKKIPFDINVVIHKYNYKETDKIVEFLLNYNPDTILITFVNPHSSITDENNIPIVAIRYSDVIHYVEKSIDVAKKNKYKGLILNYFPFCIIPEWTSYSLDYSYPKEILNGTAYEVDYKNPKCLECEYYNKCFGILKTYKRIYGDDEFKPFK